MVMTSAKPMRWLDPATQRWGLPDAFVGWLLVQVIGQVVAIGVLIATGHASDATDDLPLEVVALLQVGLAFAFFIVPFVITNRKGNGLVTDLGFQVRWGDLWRGGIIGALLQWPILVILYWPILELMGKSSSDLAEPARALGDRADGLSGAVLLILIVGVMAPIFEELFFRGLMQRAFLKRRFPPWAAIGVTALVFGASHGQWLQLPALVLAGAVFGWLAYRSGRLGPAIAAHVTFNMVTVLALLLG